MAGLFRGKKFTIRLLLVLLLVLLVVLIQIVSVSRISNPQPYPWEVAEPHDKRDELRNDETFKDKERGLRTVKPLVKQVNYKYFFKLFIIAAPMCNLCCLAFKAPCILSISTLQHTIIDTL